MLRSFGFPQGLSALVLFRTDAGIKQHPMYHEAKAGTAEAALILVTQLDNTCCNSGLLPLDKNIRLINKLFPHELIEVFGIVIEDLTANEARYLGGFRSVEEIRYRLAAVKQEIDRRSLSKALSRSGGFFAGLQAEGALSGRGPFGIPLSFFLDPKILPRVGGVTGFFYHSKC